jgi:hypothetical protein
VSNAQNGEFQVGRGRRAKARPWRKQRCDWRAAYLSRYCDSLRFKCVRGRCKPGFDVPGPVRLCPNVHNGLLASLRSTRLMRQVALSRASASTLPDTDIS